MATSPTHKDIQTLEGQTLRPILAFFYEWEQNTPEAIFLRQPTGDVWVETSYREAGQIARKMATALLSKGYPPGSNIGIISKNCAQWILADLAIQMAGHVSVPFFPNLSAEQFKEVLGLSEIKLLFAGKLEFWHPESVPTGLDVIRFPHYAGNIRVEIGEEWNAVLVQHAALEGQPLPALSDLWTILFTSGTTGQPKGVMLPHRAAASILRNEQLNHDLGIFRLPAFRFFSFLPLNHVAERIAVESACFLTGGVISFGESLDTFAKNLQGTRPTFFFAVPRIWSKFQSAILKKLPPKRLDLLLSLPVLGGLLRKKIKAGLGLDQAQVILTGAAPTSESLKAWYSKLGIQLRDVYGMTETSGAITVIPTQQGRAGSVGKPVSNVQFKIVEGTGELCVKMPWMMTGYFRDEALTAATLKDGWLHTGDRARADADGYLYIIGRVKDSFKTTKGEFVVPGPIEEAFSQNLMIEQVCLVGSGLPQPLVLVVLSEHGRTVAEEKLLEKMERELKEVNASLASHARVSTMVVMKEEWTVDNHLLTPTLKVRRSKIDARFEDKYAGWHANPSPVILVGK